MDFVMLPGTQGTIDYEYDELNRLTAKLFALHPSLNTSYQYDLGSRMTDADVVGGAQIHRTYDNLNRLFTSTQTLNSSPFTLHYSYYDNDLLKNTTYPSGKFVEYTYDDIDRMDLVKVGGATLADYDYDPLDRRDTKTFSGLPSQQQADYTFDIANQLESIVNQILPSTNISTYAYPDYDHVGNRRQIDITYEGTGPVSTTYGYNDIYELTDVNAVGVYQYDLVKNRELAEGDIYTLKPNGLNQYDTAGSKTFDYDDNGNLTGDGINTYVYDEENRLASSQSPAASSQYEYDALNRRVSKDVDGEVIYFIYDGDNVIEERDGTGILIAEYVMGDDIDEVLTMARGGTDYYYHYDGLGSVTEITNNSGVIVENFEYDSYGNPSVASSLIGNPYFFTGRRWDEESGIYYYRARMYDPTIGRFLQRDPIGYTLDSLNLYEYAFNNPIRYTDPLGLYQYETTNWGIAFLHESNPFNADGGFYQQANEMGEFLGSVSNSAINTGQKAWQFHQEIHANMRQMGRDTPVGSAWGYEILAGGEMMGLGGLLMKGGAAGIAEGGALGVFGGGFFIIIGGEVVWLGYDYFKGLGERNTNFCEK